MSIDNCLTIINDRLRKLDHDHVNREFEGSIVMARYGGHRTYKVACIRWDLSPQTYAFEQNEEKQKVTMLQYFLRVYEQKIQQVK